MVTCHVKVKRLKIRLNHAGAETGINWQTWVSSSAMIMTLYVKRVHVLQEQRFLLPV